MLPLLYKCFSWYNGPIKLNNTVANIYVLLIVATMWLTHIEVFSLQNSEVDTILFPTFWMRKGGTEGLSDFAATTMYTFWGVVLNSHGGSTGA